MDTVTYMYANNAKEDPLPNMDEQDLNENVPKPTFNERRERRTRKR